MSIGQRIKDARTDKKMTQKELANLLDISEAQIGQYERGYRNPKYETLEKIADALAIPVSQLTGSPDLDLLFSKLKNLTVEANNDYTLKYMIDRLNNLGYSLYMDLKNTDVSFESVEFIKDHYMYVVPKKEFNSIQQDIDTILRLKIEDFKTTKVEPSDGEDDYVTENFEVYFDANEE